MSKEWSNIHIEFISGGTGEISLEFRGGWFDDLKVNRHEIWVTDIDFKGGEIINSELTETDEDGNITGWSGMKEFKDGEKYARSSKRSALIWHDEPIVQKVPVTAGKKYKISAWFKPNVV